jgi:general secretion pathway protein B
MSLILDALRKIELERKAKRLSSQLIRNDVLQYRGIAPPAVKAPVIPILVGLLLISAAAGCFFYFTKPQPAKIDTAMSQKVLQEESTPIKPVQPLQPAPATQPLQETVPAEAKHPAPPIKKSAETVTMQQRSGIEGFTVSGIAWQDEHSLRRAVINGKLVGEGAEIDGAKIIEIKESRVIFRRGGNDFEVAHSSGSGRL